jgi:hypothetical protein
MFSRKRALRVALIVAVIASLSILAVPDASAQFRLRFESGPASLTVEDNAAGDLDVRPGLIVVVGVTVGSFSVNQCVALSEPQMGNGSTEAHTDVQCSASSNASGGTLLITFADTGFGYPENPLTLKRIVGGILNGSGGSSITFRTFGNAANATPLNSPPPTTIPAGSAPGGGMAATFGPGTYQNTDQTLAFVRTPGQPYSILQQAEVVIAGAGNFGFDQETLVNGGPPGQCDIVVDKECAAPPVIETFLCSDAKPINSISMKWSGASSVHIKAWKGAIGSTLLYDSAVAGNPIAPGEEITVDGYAGSPNDVIWELFDAVTSAKIGNSTFHLSCSDADMNGSEDCGKTAGDGKALQGFINQWLFEGMAGNGKALECNPTITFTNTCVAEPGSPFTCSNAKPINDLTMGWNGPGAINIKAWKGAIGSTLLYDSAAANTPISPGDEVTVKGFAGSPNDVIWELFDKNSGAKLGNSTFHLSCSDADMNGPEDCGKAAGDGKALQGFINQWLFKGMAGNGQVLDCSFPNGGSDVFYRYKVLNNSTGPLSNISLTDDKLGPIASGFSLAPGATQTFDKLAKIGVTTTNVATVVGFLNGGPTSCLDTDSVTVTVSPCDLSTVTPTVDKKKVMQKVTNGGNAAAIVSGIVVSWPVGNGPLRKVKFDGDVMWEGTVGTCNATTCTATITDAQLTTTVGKKSVGSGKTRALTFEFDSDANKTLSLYQWTVQFGADCSIGFGQ